MAGSEAVKFIINHVEVSCTFVHSTKFDLVCRICTALSTMQFLVDCIEDR
jgi:hypothetical protein